MSENIHIPGETGTKLDEINNQIAELEVKRNLELTKALSSNEPKDILRASSFLKKHEHKTKSFLFDPYQLNDSLGYKDRPTQVSYETLRTMAKTPIVKSIISTRVEQIASFSEFQEDASKTGWTIRKKRKLFHKENVELNIVERKEIEGVIYFIQNCGVEKNKYFLDSFDTFLRKFAQDTLTIDQATFEVVQNRFRKPTEFLATDGATYRLASSYNNENPSPDQEEVDGYFPAYVQLYQGLVRSDFYPWELSFGIRNLSTNIYNNGYGVSELEDMIKIVTWMLYGDTYNGKFFSQGSSPKGMIKVKGNISPDQLNSFRQQWQSQTRGTANAWTTPVVQADEIDWVDLQKTNQDMQFNQWMEYLIKLACAQYKIDPSEIGFSSLGNNQINYSTDAGIRLKYSKDKGLYPILKFIQARINQMIVNPLTEGKYEFVFTGLEENLEDISLENDIKKLTNGIISWKEIRTKYNYPQSISKDDFLLNSIWVQIAAQKQQQEQAQQQQGGGEEGGEDGPGYPSLEDLYSQKEEEGGEQPEENNGNPFLKGLNEFIDKTLIHATK